MVVSSGEANFGYAGRNDIQSSTGVAGDVKANRDKLGVQISSGDGCPVVSGQIIGPVLMALGNGLINATVGQERKKKDENDGLGLFINEASESIRVFKNSYGARFTLLMVCFIAMDIQSKSFGSGFRLLQYSLHLGVLLLCYPTSIITSDPGIVTNGSASPDQTMESSLSQVDKEMELLASGLGHGSTHDSGLLMRVRYCETCKAYIKGLDHHCPAFGNCIGQNNHRLFLILLFGLIATEASYLVCSSLFVAKSGIFDRPSELTLSESLAVSTILFTILQLLWQVVFVIWHIYCVCANIRTDEWIKWKKYPEFQLVIPPKYILQHQFWISYFLQSVC
ncbi:uncharacterized protein LOC133730420 [Rosa rugosa]|uniref:uncharacterized protein LOC133730420 n=1 Tax=Rosa rugosa TaxID=74645 RepID=UPI002B414E87|nr:uncharacterized protein LOC133730420 [Rosa rugosa]